MINRLLCKATAIGLSVLMLLLMSNPGFSAQTFEEWTGNLPPEKSVTASSSVPTLNNQQTNSTGTNAASWQMGAPPLTKPVTIAPQNTSIFEDPQGTVKIENVSGGITLNPNAGTISISAKVKGRNPSTHKVKAYIFSGNALVTKESVASANRLAEVTLNCMGETCSINKNVDPSKFNLSGQYFFYVVVHDQANKVISVSDRKTLLVMGDRPGPNPIPNPNPNPNPNPQPEVKVESVSHQVEVFKTVITAKISGYTVPTSKIVEVLLRKKGASGWLKQKMGFDMKDKSFLVELKSLSEDTEFEYFVRVSENGKALAESAIASFKTLISTKIEVVGNQTNYITSQTMARLGATIKLDKPDKIKKVSFILTYKVGWGTATRVVAVTDIPGGYVSGQIGFKADAEGLDPGTTYSVTLQIETEKGFLEKKIYDVKTYARPTFSVEYDKNKDGKLAGKIIVGPPIPRGFEIQYKDFSDPSKVLEPGIIVPYREIGMPGHLAINPFTPPCAKPDPVTGTCSGKFIAYAKSVSMPGYVIRWHEIASSEWLKVKKNR